METFNNPKELVEFLKTKQSEKSYVTIDFNTAMFSKAELGSELTRYTGSGLRLLRIKNNRRTHDIIMNRKNGGSIYIENGSSKGRSAVGLTDQEFDKVIASIIKFVGDGKVYENYSRPKNNEYHVDLESAVFTAEKVIAIVSEKSI